MTNTETINICECVYECAYLSYSTVCACIWVSVCMFVFIHISLKIWVEPVVKFWAWAAGSWASCSPGSCVRVWDHLALLRSHAACLQRRRAVKTSLRPWDHHSAGRNGPWETETDKSKREKQSQTVRQADTVPSLFSISIFYFVFGSISKYFEHNQPAIIVEVVWSTPAMVFTPLSLPTGPLWALNVGHPVNVYRENLEHNEPK